MEHKTIKIACFITPHGFGHATRITAVLEALQKRSRKIHSLLFTTVPQSLFAETLYNFSYHPLACDVGLIQKSSIQTDLPATIQRLQEFLPFDDTLVNKYAQEVAGCSLVLCDIATLGIAVAKKAGIASVLIENFTWDWIYKAYLPSHPGLLPFIKIFTSYYRMADIHIRTAPYCSSGKADLTCGPIFRSIRTPRSTIRKQLGCQNKRIVLISMGGIALELPFMNLLPSASETFFVLAGQKKNRLFAKNVLLLARDSDLYHPDLINGADLIVCKSGYSTVAECFQAGVPIVTVGRITFPESAILEQFCADNLHGQALGRKEFLSGSWLDRLDHLCSKPRTTPASTNGADTVAELLLRHLQQSF